MEAIDDIDLYGMEELLGHGDDLRLLTNDWPGNDLVSVKMDMVDMLDFNEKFFSKTLLLSFKTISSACQKLFSLYITFYSF